jgi:hypothetical protein
MQRTQISLKVFACVLHWIGFKVLRDISLMWTDVLQVGMVLFELQNYAKEHGVTFSNVLVRRQHLVCSAVTSVLMLLYVVVFP